MVRHLDLLLLICHDHCGRLAHMVFEAELAMEAFEDRNAYTRDDRILFVERDQVEQHRRDEAALVRLRVHKQAADDVVLFGGVRRDERLHLLRDGVLLELDKLPKVVGAHVHELLVAVEDELLERKRREKVRLELLGCGHAVDQRAQLRVLPREGGVPVEQVGVVQFKIAVEANALLLVPKRDV